MKKILIIVVIIFILIFMSQLKLPLDQISKSIIEKTVDEFLEDKVFDLTWKNTFHWITFFESLDGFTVAADSHSIDHANLVITTSDVEDNTAYVKKQPSIQGLITFSQRSNMRTAFIIGSVADVTAYMLVGNTGANDYYGFKIVNNSLKGVSKDGTTEKTVDLQTISASTVYGIEARYSPADKIIFLVDAVEKGVINQNLPSRTEVAEILPLHFSIQTNTTAAKTLQFSFWEYLQSRNILR